MKDKWKKFFMNPWTIAIGSSLIILAISVINDLINKKQIFSTFMTVYRKSCNIIIAILNYRIRVWWLLLGMIILFLLFALYIKYIELTTKKQNEPDFLEYMQDVILGYEWRWTWEKNYYGKYYVDALCPICLRCEEEYSRPFPDLEYVKMLISDNVRRRYFQDK